MTTGTTANANLFTAVAGDPILGLTAAELAEVVGRAAYRTFEVGG